MLYSPNLHWTEGANLAALVRQVWHAPVMLIQEQRALALGRIRRIRRVKIFNLLVLCWPVPVAQEARRTAAVDVRRRPAVD